MNDKDEKGIRYMAGQAGRHGRQTVDRQAHDAQHITFYVPVMASLGSWTGHSDRELEVKRGEESGRQPEDQATGRETGLVKATLHMG